MGDVQADTAVVWGRATSAGWLRVWYRAESGEDRPDGHLSASAQVDQQGATAATFALQDLHPDTQYQLVLEHVHSPPQGQVPDWSGPTVRRARFRTAPTPAQAVPVSFVVAGDLGGQGFCRPVAGGYRIFSAMAAAEPQFALFNGDLIYADGTCGDLDPNGEAQVAGQFVGTADPSLDWTQSAQVRAAIGAHWRYNRADKAVQGFLDKVPIVVQWDDHEVVNDFGGGWSAWHTGDPDRPGYPNLVAQARTAVFTWNPLVGHPDEPERIYRSLQWGQHLGVFVVDARSYRDRNDLPDGPDKTLLGTAQRDWLRASVLDSPASFKIISSDVPISIPTGWDAWRVGRDGWANGMGDARLPGGETDRSTQTGFEHELRTLLTAFDAARVTGLVFVTTDVHHAQSIRYSVDLDGDGHPLVFHEFVTGPLRAWRGVPGPLDPSFGPTALFGVGGVDNFGHYAVEADPDGGVALVAQVRGIDGRVMEGSEVRIRP